MNDFFLEGNIFLTTFLQNLAGQCLSSDFPFNCVKHENLNCHRRKMYSLTDLCNQVKRNDFQQNKSNIKIENLTISFNRGTKHENHKKCALSP